MPPKSRARTLADQVEWAKVAYYGIPGTGKTTNLAHLAKLGDLTYVQADRSVRKGALARLGLPVDRIYPVDELDPVKLEAMCWTWAEALVDDQFSIAVDTMTELVARRIERSVDDAWALELERAAAVDAEPPDPAGKGSKRFFVDRDYYQTETQEMRRFLRHLRDLPCHVAISAQRRLGDDGMFGPDVNPAIQGDVMGYSNQVIRLETDGVYTDGDKEDVFIGFTRPTRTHHAKDRDRILPRILAQPTMDRVVAYLNGDMNKDTDSVQARYRDLVIARNKRAS